MRRYSTLSALALTAALAAPLAHAQTNPTPTAASAAPADPVVATVNNLKIHLSDVQAAAQGAPAQMQQMPQDQLFSLLVNQEIDRKAILVAARKEDLEHDPAVAAAMEDAADIKLENAYVQQQVTPAVSDTAVQAAYNQDYAGKPGPQQVDARHILVKTQAEAEAIINQLNHGANFATLAEKDSIDPGAKNGGELGWFTQDQMVPAFANAAFALKPGEYTKTPVQTQFGWHVILCEGKRNEPTPTLADVQGQIRQNLAEAQIQKVIAAVRANVKIKVFNPDGTPTTPVTAAPAK
ncbi:MAG: peptidylprolyl isomerase [Acidocella sp.]|nr:peptidylprolyl isomerase [Acidocella sp.]